jgi:hypothetical protein
LLKQVAENHDTDRKDVGTIEMCEIMIGETVGVIHQNTNDYLLWVEL